MMFLIARVTVNEQCDLVTKATALLWATPVIALVTNCSFQSPCLRANLNKHKDPERRWKQDTPNVNSQGDKQVADGNLCLRQNLEWHREPAQ